MTESEKKSTKKKTHKKSKSMEFSFALWSKLENKAEEENIENMSEYIRHICREYLKTDGFKNQIGKDEEMERLIKRQEQILDENLQFYNNLNSLLKSAKNNELPLDYEEKTSQILTVVENQKLAFEGILEATKIPKEQLVVLLGNLVESQEIMYDNRWRFYKA